MTNPTHTKTDVLERLAYSVANAKLGEGPSVRCEGPTEYEIGQARDWVRRVLAALDDQPIIEAQAKEIERLRCPLEKFERRIRQSSNDVDCALIARSLAEDLGIALTNTHPDKQGA